MLWGGKAGKKQANESSNGDVVTESSNPENKKQGIEDKNDEDKNDKDNGKPQTLQELKDKKLKLIKKLNNLRKYFDRDFLINVTDICNSSHAEPEKTMNKVANYKKLEIDLVKNLINILNIEKKDTTQAQKFIGLLETSIKNIESGNKRKILYEAEKIIMQDYLDNEYNNPNKDKLNPTYQKLIRQFDLEMKEFFSKKENYRLIKPRYDFLKEITKEAKEMSDLRYAQVRTVDREYYVLVTTKEVILPVISKKEYSLREVSKEEKTHINNIHQEDYFFQPFFNLAIEKADKCFDALYANQERYKMDARMHKEIQEFYLSFEPKITKKTLLYKEYTDEMVDFKFKFKKYFDNNECYMFYHNKTMSIESNRVIFLIKKKYINNQRNKQLKHN